jgi:hypothetical protein
MLRSVLRSLAESVGAAYGCSILAFFLGVGLTPFSGEHRRDDLISIASTFLLPAASGAIVAYFTRKHASKASYFAWIVPGFLFFRAFLEVTRSPYASSSKTWDTLLGPDCSSSECLYVAFFTVPLVCGISYSLSSAFLSARRSSHSQDLPKPRSYHEPQGKR